MGQQGTLTRVWAKRGTRLRAPRDTRYPWAYIFGAVCPERGVAAGLVMPFADTPAMNAHLAGISRTVVPSAHAVLVLDGAGWHGGHALLVPDNISLVVLPPCSPELNPVENVNRTRFLGHSVGLRGHGHGGKFMLATQSVWAEVAVLLDQSLGVVAGDEGADRLADVIDGLEDAAVHDLLLQGPEESLDDAVVDAFCAAWNRFAEKPDVVSSITSRQWPEVSRQGR